MANLSYQFWFRSREDYEAIRRLVTDEPRLCNSFEQWQQTANEFIEKQRASYKREKQRGQPGKRHGVSIGDGSPPQGHGRPSTSVRCAAAIFPESEVDRTRRGHCENGAHAE
jgi:hypothetical protein